MDAQKLEKPFPSIFTQFIRWWFVSTPKAIFQGTIRVMANTFNYFSVLLLLKTLFSPWKRDIISLEHLGLGQKVQVMVMNLVSRLIGAVVRFMTVIVGIVAVILELIIGMGLLAGFIFLPAIAIAILILPI